MTNQELMELIENETKAIDGHYPIKVAIKNNTDQGQWVDIFRHKKYSGIEIYCPYGTYDQKRVYD